MTRTAFLNAYRSMMIANHEWALDTKRLDSFMEMVALTINTRKNHVSLTTAPLAQRAFNSIGCEGRLTFKAIRALPLN